jgi:hypothetical protein
LLEEIDGELLALRSEIESLEARADFPAEGLEELNLLVGARDSLSKQLSDIRGEKDAAVARLSNAERERQALLTYASFAAGSDAEKITEWFVSYLSISLQKDGLQKTVSRLLSEADALEARLSQLSPAFADPAADWHRVAREAAEDEQAAAQHCAVLAENLAQEKAILTTAARSALGRRVLGALALVIGCATAATPFVSGFGVFSPLTGVGIGCGFAVIAAILLSMARMSAKTAREAKGTVIRLESDLDSARKEGGKKRKHVNDVMAESGFHKVDDFLAAAKQSEQDRLKLVNVRAQLAESESQKQKLESQSEEMYQLLKDGLAKVGLSCSPGNLKFQIDLFRSNIRHYRELDAKYAHCAQRAEALKARDAELTNEHELNSTRLRSLLDSAQVETPEKFREECLKRQRLLELLERESSRAREFQRLAGDRTLPQWQEHRLQLAAQEEEGICETVDTAPAECHEDSTPLLPYQPGIAELEEQERKISLRLSAFREEFARVVERIAQAFQSFRSASEIEEDLALAEQDLKGLDSNRLALSMALETIEKLSKQQQEVLAPQLNAAVEQRFLRLCGGRYGEVKIDPDFQVWVREPDSGELRSAESLSRGTQDQIYFSLRFGVLDLVSNEEEPCPSLLDEPFAAYDRTRLTEAFHVMASESVRRQILLFTCREDLLDLAREHNAHIIRL